MRILYLSLASLCLVVFQTGANVSQNRIRRVADRGGGKPAEPHQYPWMAMLTDTDQFFCGGSLLRIPCNNEESDIVLTAAHCLVEQHVIDGAKILTRNYTQMAPPRVHFGNHIQNQMDTGEVKHRISQSEYFPQWQINGSFDDIAIIRLKEPVKFTETIQPIRLPGLNQGLAQDAECIIAGWGSTYDKPIPNRLNRLHPYEPQYPKVLHHMNVSIVSSEKCIWRNANSPWYNKEKMYCVSPVERDLNNKSSSCGGDSGGPVFRQDNGEWTVHGVCSFGDAGCGKENPISMPGVYGKIEPYLDWIEEKIRTWSSVYKKECKESDVKKLFQA